ncbi:hypothetical protein NCAS_0D03080 [Naumovozyma castellii]|uniref:Uncharacterized protein n=1 Tax=Naumovozyma castellii TaxID=27288 RepID=G0VE98_NAUCA|nr:hypothetical protein NCAS_0D03080 [Naumovozyma castellii CBS 4309]CCC69889.1 hypothetical protein NCAS_0D03080 [Naumovozyma castellii CBS 4309]
MAPHSTLLLDSTASPTATHLCNEYHPYDTGAFDSIISTLVNTFKLNIFKDPNNVNTLHIHRGDLEIDPIENIIAVCLILFIFSLIFLIVFGVFIICIINIFSNDPNAKSQDDDLEKQLTTTITGEQLRKNELK